MFTFYGQDVSFLQHRTKWLQTENIHVCETKDLMGDSRGQQTDLSTVLGNPKHLCACSERHDQWKGLSAAP